MMKLPAAVEITEVGPRDGFQNIKTQIPTVDKIKIIEALSGCGFKKIEITSFVHPKAVLQMADAAEVLSAIKRKFSGQFTCVTLVPNFFGAQRAIELGADEITFVISASERHNLENTKQTVEQSLSAFARVCSIKGSVIVRLAVATAFTCPFTGVVPPENVAQLIEAGKAAGADDVALADTLGTANPLQVESLLNLLIPRYGNNVVLHIHDTYGMGLANVLTCLNMGITRFESSVGGLGGCPFAPGASGNIATEDLVNMLHMMNIRTGIDLDKLVQVAHMAEDTLHTPLSGHVMRSRKK
jgi:hydroxymethylglutaryl-CoA lyase